MISEFHVAHFNPGSVSLIKEVLLRKQVDTLRNLKMSERETRVLSIQSHVVHGYCGNKSAVFPLQVRNCL